MYRTTNFGDSTDKNLCSFEVQGERNKPMPKIFRNFNKFSNRKFHILSNLRWKYFVLPKLCLLGAKAGAEMAFLKISLYPRTENFWTLAKQLKNILEISKKFRYFEDFKVVLSSFRKFWEKFKNLGDFKKYITI